MIPKLAGFEVQPLGTPEPIVQSAVAEHEGISEAYIGLTFVFNTS
jgi:hypothetical protein